MQRISSLRRGTSCWLHAAAAAAGRQQTGCCTAAAGAAGGPPLAAVTGMTKPFVGHTAVRWRPTTVQDDDTTADCRAGVCPMSWRWTGGQTEPHADQTTV